MKEAYTNKELLILMKEGDMHAFDAIYQKYSKRVYGFVLKYLKQKSDAEEIVQEVFIKIWEARAEINLFSSFESFLFTIAHNTAISLLRKRLSERKYLHHIKAIQELEGEVELIDEFDYAELNDNVRKLINQLTLRQKEVFMLSRDDGLSHEKIAIRLGISVNTVKNHITASLSYLRARMVKS